MKKIHEWLADLGSHDIYSAAPCAVDFTKQTGHQPCWPEHSLAETRKDIAKRGLGGHVKEEPGKCAYGYEIAAALARKYADFRSAAMGRGFIFQACLEALRSKDV